ncbi:uncharacterized protein LOC114517786 isoform X2 [Dendronephthya gigantea]|uniref:uncharacterized protein LOC114517786 isoform X2 n=1 Tax=Dendronephthya gigantea TaxID=151771 RepID=UPI00106B294C|nr:uncharacterized protein LOC114517786 isoform X2 [Dendronephthya gigantea]
MAILWTFLATFLIADCAVNAKTVLERDNGITRFRAPEDETALERRGVQPCGCETGNTEWVYCYPKSCAGKTITINLSGEYVKPPSVSVAIASLDVDHEYNTRIKAEAVSITTSSFGLKYWPYSDTKLYGVKFAWTACA